MGYYSPYLGSKNFWKATNMKKILPALLAALLLSACPKEDDTPPPEPQQISDRAVGHYCSMNLTEHNGPKAQIYLNGKPDRPVWFSTIKQMFGYTKLPEEPKGIHVIYVTDMGKVKDWSKPNADTAWIDGKKAYYVIESGFIGGMGAEDALPFADKAQAEKFAKEKGGRVVSFDEMPDSYIFILPPSFEVLAERLIGRGTDSEEVIQTRLSKARHEIEQSVLFDYIVVNDDLDRAEADLLHIIKAGRLKKSSQQGFISNLLENS